MKELIKSFNVTEEYSAKAMGSGDLDVLASPALVAFAENVCKEICDNTLGEGQTTVGILVELGHIKASLVGSTINLTAQLIQHEGKKYVFEFYAEENEELIAQGTHHRVAVDKENFIKKLIDTSL